MVALGWWRWDGGGGQQAGVSLAPVRGEVVWDWMIREWRSGSATAVTDKANALEEVKG